MSLSSSPHSTFDHQYQSDFWDMIYKQVFGGKDMPITLGGYLIDTIKGSTRKNNVDNNIERHVWLGKWLEKVMKTNSGFLDEWVSWWTDIAAETILSWHEQCGCPSTTAIRESVKQTSTHLLAFIEKQRQKVIQGLTMESGFLAFSFFERDFSQMPAQHFFFSQFISQIHERALMLDAGSHEVFIPFLLKRVHESKIISDQNASANLNWVTRVLKERVLGEYGYDEDSFWPSHSWLTFSLGILRLSWWEGKLKDEKFLAKQYTSLLRRYKKIAISAQPKEFSIGDIYYELVQKIVQGKYRETGNFEAYISRLADGQAREWEQSQKAKALMTYESQVNQIMNHSDNKTIQEGEIIPFILQSLTFLIEGILHFFPYRAQSSVYARAGTHVFEVLLKKPKKTQYYREVDSIINFLESFGLESDHPLKSREVVVEMIPWIGELIGLMEKVDYDQSRIKTSLIEWVDTFRKNKAMVSEDERSWFSNRENPFILSWDEVAHDISRNNETEFGVISTVVLPALLNDNSDKELAELEQALGARIIALHGALYTLTTYLN